MSAHVAPAYAHHAKQATPRGLIAIGSSEIKFYHLEKPGEPVPAAIAAAARDRLAGDALAVSGLEGDLGFAILHRCGADFHFLLIGVWRGSNELWEAVWYRDAGMHGFAPFDPAYPAGAGTLRPTFCVWELGIVGHESLAWSRYLASPRGEGDLARWREELFEGPV
jgi:hypothetical protein